MNKTIGRILLLACAWPGVAQADYLGTNDIPYAFGSGLYEFPDSNRDSDDGYGFELGLGYPLSRDGEALELSVTRLQRDRDIDGKNDYQTGLFLNWTRDLNLGIAGVEPYLLLGAGAVQDDVRGDKHIHAGINGGLGSLYDLGWRDLALRLEVLAQAQLNDESVPDEDYLIDYQVRVGLQLPLSFLYPTPETPPAEECPVRVVDPKSGRSDCAVDTDGDGVDDTRDQCPGTTAGIVVDTRGCDLSTSGDADRDGVPDAADTCADTPAGTHVDTSGCVAKQAISLAGVRFESDSHRLTGEAKEILDGVAVQLAAQADIRAEIGGHTDAQGNDAYNLELSQRRADSVRQYLIGQGVSADRVTAKGYGETQPLESNDSEPGREANRRVEFVIQSP